MSESKVANAVIRATNECKVNPSKSDPSKSYGFQTLGLRGVTGMWKEFNQIYDPTKASHFLPPGDYEVVPNGAYLDRLGRLVLGKEFVLIPAVKS